MANARAAGRDGFREAVGEVVDASLEMIHSERELSVKRLRKLKLIARLDEAYSIELERARHRVHRAQVNERSSQAELRDASEDLEKLQEIGEALRADWHEVIELESEDEHILDEGERAVRTKAPAAGALFVSAELVKPGGMVAAHKRLRDAKASRAEVEAI